ncbi:App1 family protein [Chryseolinea sp. T2]|uniref:App1 family protein n=1 Tax=Chryseolinea sp. T2 TaxID=3129255 RepID=UPI0030768842
MSANRVPILLNYYALANEGRALIYGQITTKRPGDLSFNAFSRRTTFRTLLSLYRSRALTNTTVKLHYQEFELEAVTDETGFFMVSHDVDQKEFPLYDVTVDGKPVLLLEGLYDRSLNRIVTPDIVVSDIDDTILHSHISRKLRKLSTLMFTPVERRMAVEPVKELIQRIVDQGATAFYLSNSEQNLYPLIYRFLILNSFPAGPVFLKQMRRLRDVIRYRKLPTPEVHKLKMLNILLPMFPEKNFVLIGDNTQYDLSIYLTAAKNYPDNVKAIYIRRAIPMPDELAKAAELKEQLAKSNIEFHYGDDFASVKWPESNDLIAPAKEAHSAEPSKGAILFDKEQDGQDLNVQFRNPKPGNGSHVNKP